MDVQEDDTMMRRLFQSQFFQNSINWDHQIYR